jgi:aldehyde dehydrogenase (NAD+)
MPTRMLLPRSRYDEGLEIVMQAFRDLKYGDPTDFDNLQGPQINRVQRDKILAMIERGVAEGARLVVGGGRPAHLEKGWYVEPTVFADVDNSMSIAREEIFGPVLSVIPFDDDEDAVRIANDSDYGLSGMVTAGDLDRALAVASRIRSGTMSVNGGQWYGAEAPFGGFKASGVGRQNGDEGFEQYLETRTIGMPRD